VHEIREVFFVKYVLFISSLQLVIFINVVQYNLNNFDNFLM